VLKIVAPKPEFASESRAQSLYKGEGAAELIAVDSQTNSMLLELLQPGAPLAELHNDDSATRIAARLMKKLWRPSEVGCILRTVEDWAAKRLSIDAFISEKLIPNIADGPCFRVAARGTRD
jgi:streptomycin 6-kinase